MKEALLYQRLEGDRIRCDLCAHRCVIDSGQRGLCGVRENRSGRLYSLVYGRTISRNVDPIEKKPLYHVYPGSRAFSVATPGCNFRCSWCQNCEISQWPRERGEVLAGEAFSPEQIVAAAQASGCRSIAYTYTEPTIFFEYSYATAQLARQAGIANLYISNGYMTAAMLELLHPWLAAANIDLKTFRDTTYRQYAGARLQPVLDSLRTLHQYGVWLEVTTLIIPGINDDPAELAELTDFIARELGPQTPWHVSRFFPRYRLLELPPTPPETISRAVEIGHQAGLVHIYPGNLGGDAQTYCPDCRSCLIARSGLGIRENRISAAQTCPDCGAAVAGLGLAG